VHVGFAANNTLNLTCGWLDCGKTLSSRTSAIYHSTTHFPHFTYKCTACGRGWKSRRDLLKHVADHHSGGVLAGQGFRKAEYVLRDAEAAAAAAKGPQDVDTEMTEMRDVDQVESTSETSSSEEKSSSSDEDSTSVDEYMSPADGPDNDTSSLISDNEHGDGNGGGAHDHDQDGSIGDTRRIAQLGSTSDPSGPTSSARQAKRASPESEPRVGNVKQSFPMQRLPFHGKADKYYPCDVRQKLSWKEAPVLDLQQKTSLTAKERIRLDKSLRRRDALRVIVCEIDAGRMETPAEAQLRLGRQQRADIEVQLTDPATKSVEKLKKQLIKLKQKVKDAEKAVEEEKKVEVQRNAS
jgi:hypothetical protein